MLLIYLRSYLEVELDFHRLELQFQMEIYIFVLGYFLFLLCDIRQGMCIWVLFKSV
jgi:hypothetical protein